MRFVNDTPYPADLFRSERQRDVMYNALVGRVRYHLIADQPLIPATGDHALLDLRRHATTDDYAQLEPDEIYGRTGTDLIVLGDAGATHPVTRLDLRVAAGAYDHTLRIHGDRVWERKFGAGPLRPSPPLAFTAMPVTYHNAFGGVAPGEFGGVPFAANPIGKGFYMSEKDALDQPLPNVEDPGAPISAWDDHPEPVGTAPYPQLWSMRLRSTLSRDPATGEHRIAPTPEFYDRAHPRLSGKPLLAGQWVRLTGFAGKPLIGFRVPPCPLVAEIQIGARHYAREPVLEEVLIDLRSGHVDLSYRKQFHYPIRLREHRRTTLRIKPD